MTRPTLETERLLLRPFRLEDAPDVHRLASAREIAADYEVTDKDVIPAVDSRFRDSRSGVFGGA